MSRETILADIDRVLNEQLNINRSVDPATDLMRDLQLDSIQQMTLVVELENHFQVCFQPGDEYGISTVSSVVDLVDRSLQAAGR